MSAEDRAAQPLPREMYEAVIRAARETAREEVRAAMDAQKAQASPNCEFKVPTVMHGQPV